MSQQVIYKSLQQFLFRKNMITQAILTAAREKDELWNNTMDEAYKSYATHCLGIHAPLIPTSVFQVDPRILDDADWVLLDSADSDAGLNAVPATPRQNTVQEPEDPKDDGEEMDNDADDNTGRPSGTSVESGSEFVSTPTGQPEDNQSQEQGESNPEPEPEDESEPEDLQETDEEPSENTFVPGANSDEGIEDPDETDDESAS